MTKAITYPAWFSGPKGESAIFESPDDVPNGWTSGAEQQSVDSKPAKAAPAPAKTPPAPPKTPAPKAPAKADKTELDSDGHPFDPALHAKTQSKTQDGKWRMKVGVKRPDPVVKPPLDL